MGSPLGPVIANLLKSYNERNWVREFDIGKVLLHRRYVDAIICIFKNEIDAYHFFKYLNSQQPNLPRKRKPVNFYHFKLLLLKTKVKKVGHLLLQCNGRIHLLDSLCNIAVSHFSAPKLDS